MTEKANNTKLRLHQKLLIVLACMWVTSASVAPDMTSIGPIRVRPEDIITVFMAISLIVQMLFYGIRRESLRLVYRIVLISCGFGLTGILAILIGFLSGISFAEKGAFEFSLVEEILKEYIRFGKYIVVALVFSAVSFRAWKPITSVLVACCFIIIAIQVMQYLGVGGINEWIETTYKYDESRAEISRIGAKEAGYWKSGSVMVQPNVLGMFFILPQLLFLMMFLSSLDKRTYLAKRHRLFWLCLSCFVWLGIFMTQSITALLSTIFGLFVASLFIPFRSRLRLYSSFFLFLIFIVISMIYVFGSGMTKFTSAGFVRGFGEGSLGIKIGNTMEVIEQLGIQIVVGAGPANSIMVDNEIGYILVWYGIIGMFIFFMFYKSLYRQIKTRIQDVYIQATFLGTLGAYLLGAIGASCFLNNRVFPFFIALLSVACADEFNFRSKTSGDGVY